ncbi:MAG: hypothetical protein H6732_02310 [Alphaproteobacteria bacterium]|nr:hypothetical protein [Alphaproteobacteria bacterium]
MRAALLALVAACTPEVVPPDLVDTDDPDAHDALSRPAEPTLSTAGLSGALACSGCHPDHYAAWRTSMHAYAMHDPVFRALQRARVADHEGRQAQFCTQCHTPLGSRDGDVLAHPDLEGLGPLSVEGVTCEVCHTVASVARTSQAGLVLDVDGPMRGTLPDPEPTAAHATTHSPLHGTAELCAACHDVREVGGLPLERPYAEWRSSPAGREGRPCQSCHMPETRGPAAVGGPERVVHRHGWIGGGMPLLPGFLDDTERAARLAEVTALLQGAAALDVDAPMHWTPGGVLPVVVTVRNLVDGHAFPTGTTFNRQVWVEVTVTDEADAVLYRSGDLDEDGNLRDVWSRLDPFGDADLVTLSSTLSDGHGDPVLFPWVATEHTGRALPPALERTFTWLVPVPSAPVGRLHARVRLLYRQYGPHLLEALDVEAGPDALPVLEVATGEIEVFPPP